LTGALPPRDQRPLARTTNADRRLLAARTLGQRGDPAAIPPPGELVNDPDPYLAAAALTCLATIAGLNSVAHIVRQLDQHAEGAPVRAAARHLLASANR
jgi:HEAT repeat protein